MAIFQVCQPTRWTGLAVAWGVVRSLAGFVVAGPSGCDYIGVGCLPWLGSMRIREVSNVAIACAGYVDIM